MANDARPIQVVIAGKAHPQDDDPKRQLREVFELRHSPHVGRRITFLDDYDIEMARHLVSGTDLWVNVPRPPLEASGTRGMKAAANGGLNLSVLDGWWSEGFDGETGWGIETPEAGPAAQDDHDAAALYDLLERDVVPLFYGRDASGVPAGWIGRIKTSMRRLIPRFSAERMVREYLAVLMDRRIAHRPWSRVVGVSVRFTTRGTAPRAPENFRVAIMRRRIRRFEFRFRNQLFFAVRDARSRYAHCSLGESGKLRIHHHAPKRRKEVMKRAVTSFVAAAVIGLPLAVMAEMPPAGTKITKENMDKYKESMSPTMQYFVRNGMEIPVIEHKKIDWPPSYKAATEKYSAQVKLSPDGRDMLNYVAGSPFPVIDENDPQAGAKWMWNHEQKSVYTDNVGCGWNVELVNQKGERERFFGSNFWRRMQWRGRLDMDPKPTMAHDPAIGYTEQWGPLHDPNDLKGAGVLNFRYVSPDVPDDSYLYLPELRKVRRLSMANRSDAFWGTDIDIDSIWTWNSKLSFWTFKYLGMHPLLGALHAGGYAQREAWCAQPDGTSGTKAFVWCLPHEIRDTAVVEGTPTGFSQYAFSKRVLYIDKETFMAQYNEGYDQGGELWKSWYMASDTGTSPHGIEKAADGSMKVVDTKTINPPKYDYERVYPVHGGVVDMQLNHASHWDCPDGYLYPNIGVKHWYHNVPRDWNTPDNFTINYLIKSAGF